MGNYSVQAQINELKRWVGFHEGWNNIQPFTAWQFYGSMRNLAWCGSFADWCAVEKGGFRWPSYCQCGYRGDAFVPSIVDHAQRMGIWRDRNAHARPGWQAIYNWDGGQADHVETVIWDDGNYTTNIGGNTGDMVAYRQRPKNWTLMGFAALDEAGQNQTGTIPPPNAPPINTSTGGSNMQPSDQVYAISNKDSSGTYRLQANGDVLTAGKAVDHGGVNTTKNSRGGDIKLIMGVNHAVAMITTQSGKGYWVIGYDGGVFSFGDAAYLGNFLSYKRHITGVTAAVKDGKWCYAAIADNGLTLLPK